MRIKKLYNVLTYEPIDELNSLIGKLENGITQLQTDESLDKLNKSNLTKLSNKMGNYFMVLVMKQSERISFLKTVACPKLKNCKVKCPE